MMKIKLTIVAVALSSMCSAQAFDLWQTYLDAQRNDAVYLAATAQNDIAAAQKKQARAAILPTVALTGSVYSKRDTFLSTRRTVKTQPATLGVSLNQPLIDIGSLTAFKQVGLNTNSAALKVQQAEQDLIVRTVQAYFTALLAQTNAQVAEGQRSVAARQVEMARRNFEVGNTTVIDQKEAEAAYYNARAAEITAQSNKNNAWAALEDLVGHPINEPLATLPESLRLKMPVPDSQEQWVARAQRESYAVRIAQLADEMAQIEIRRRSQQRLPKLDLVASQQWKRTNWNHDNDVSSRNTSVGLELSMPLFDGGMIGAQVDEARALQKQSAQGLRNAQNTVAQGTRVAYSQAVAGLSSMEALESARSAANASVKANERGYNLGMRINVDVLNAHNAAAQTQYNLAQAQYNTVLGNVNLKAAIAQLGEEDVHYINALLTPPKTAASK
ncbi:MAG: TolC family outer membrane protein [Formosimonas sp.]